MIAKNRLKRDLKPGEPCDHPGCLSHITHPCEGCGRTAGKGYVFVQQHLWEPWPQDLKVERKVLDL